jgi:hypothetical protein
MLADYVDALAEPTLTAAMTWLDETQFQGSSNVEALSDLPADLSPALAKSLLKAMGRDYVLSYVYKQGSPPVIYLNRGAGYAAEDIYRLVFGD